MMVANAARPATPASVGRLEPATWALGAGGFLFSLGNLLHPLEHNDAAYRSPTWGVAHLAIFMSLPLLLFGLPSLRRALGRRGQGGLTAAALALAVVGLVGMAPGLLVEAFIAPEVGYSAMLRFEETGFGIVSGLLPAAWVLSSAVLGLACHRARFGPSWAQALLVAASLLLILSVVPGPIGGVMIILGTAGYGIAAAILGWELGSL